MVTQKLNKMIEKKDRPVKSTGEKKDRPEQNIQNVKNSEIETQVDEITPVDETPQTSKVKELLNIRKRKVRGTVYEERRKRLRRVTVTEELNSRRRKLSI